MDDALFQALESGAVVVTATKRLSAHLRAKYRARQRAAGHAVWESPAVLPHTAWLARLWDEIGESSAADRQPLLLPDAVTSVLWERIILESKTGPRLLHPEKAAELAKDAYTLANQWRVPLSNSETTEELRTFREWRAIYEKRCAEENWLDLARLPDAIAEQVKNGSAVVPARIIYAGFDDLTPQAIALNDAFQGRGAALSTWRAPPVAPAAEAVRSVLPDPEAEIDAAARWARALLEKEAPSSDADPIGIVVPGLSNRCGVIERIFHEILDPGSPLHESASNRPFNLSAAPALAEVSCVRAALEWLSPLRQSTPFNQLSAMLRSPFLAGAESERDSRARLDAELRRINRAELSWEWLARFAGDAERSARIACPVLCERLGRTIEQEDKLNSDGGRKHGAVTWAEFFDKRLRRLLGWPGERPHSSHEQQAVEAWREMLAAFAALDWVVAPMTQSEAASRLRRFAQETQHQPRTEPAPVQILGVLESSGLSFSHLWLLGFDDEAWPPQAHPNPFLPIHAQRRLGLPHASPQWEFEFAQRETARMLASAPRIVASHAAQAEDRARSPSPLLEVLPQQDATRLDLGDLITWRAGVHGAGALEKLSDFRAPALLPGSHTGGVKLFQDQAACPFLAFARHRLRAGALEEPVPGLSARERGSYVHKGMELLWEKIGTHAALLEFSDEELNGLSRAAAEAAVASDTSDRERGALLGLEKQRLTQLLRSELNVEKARAPFEVLAREEPREASFGGVTVQTRVDRIDRLSGGGHVLIDYKSGDSAVSPSAWLGQRPDEPQLPLYCASSDRPIEALLFARVSQRALRDTVKSARQPKLFVGLTNSADAFPRGEFAAVPLFSEFTRRGTGESFGSREQALSAWRSTLDALGVGFREGAARVDPKRSGAGRLLPCERCDLQPLCRVQEIMGQTSREGSSADEEGADE
jgi:probable DNA repair protein